MADNSSNPKVILKKKQIPTLIDFCLEESIEFSVRQQTFPETDWEVELKLKDFKTAVLVGMFLRENKFEVDGIDPQRYRKQTSTSTSSKKSEEKADNNSPKAESSSKTEDKTKTDTVNTSSFTDNSMPTLL